MALTAQEITQLTALAQREGGIAILRNEMCEAIADRKKTAAVADLATVLSVTVTDWAGLQAWVAANKDNTALYAVLADLKAAVAAKDATKLGPLLVALTAAVLGHLGQ